MPKRQCCQWLPAIDTIALIQCHSDPSIDYIPAYCTGVVIVGAVITSELWALTQCATPSELSRLHHENIRITCVACFVIT